MTDSGLTVPRATRVVHIGFPKTGTTSVQSSLQEARGRLRELGVVYPGTERYHMQASIGVVGATPRIGDPPPDRNNWDRLAAEVEKAGDNRVLISSEWLCEGDDAAARDVVSSLGGEGVHVVVTLRPLAKILPSAWQQYVQNGMRTSYEKWLDGMLRKPPFTSPTPSFWTRQRHDQVIARWAALVGPDRLTAIVVDESDHLLLYRQFEQLLGVPPMTLEAQQRVNFSLSRPQIELVRRLNSAYHDEQWPAALYRKVVRMGVAEYLARETKDLSAEPRIVTPQWALDKAAEIGGGYADAIAAMGVGVIGDLESLGRNFTAAPSSPESAALLSTDVGAIAVTGAINAAREFGNREGYQAAKAKYYDGVASWRFAARWAQAKVRNRRRARAGSVRR